MGKEKDYSRDDRGFHDPLAVKIGLDVGPNEIPADGWPETSNHDAMVEILELLPDDLD
jgi:hypothetical protein